MKENKMKKNEELNQAIEIFMQCYQPAKSISESDEELETYEITRKIVSHLGNKGINTRLVHNKLMEKGFQYIYLVNTFKWLLKNR